MVQRRRSRVRHHLASPFSQITAAEWSLWVAPARRFSCARSLVARRAACRACCRRRAPAPGRSRAPGRPRPRDAQRLQLRRAPRRCRRASKPALCSPAFAASSSSSRLDRLEAARRAASSIAPPRRALRGEQQPHPRPQLAAASIRSLQNLTIAKAVSSIERRVTSITGQPLSAKIRRAKASSALTASRVDIIGFRRLVQRRAGGCGGSGSAGRDWW